MTVEIFREWWDKINMTELGMPLIDSENALFDKWT